MLVEAEVISNSRNKIHQTCEWKFSPPHVFVLSSLTERKLRRAPTAPNTIRMLADRSIAAKGSSSCQ